MFYTDNLTYLYHTCYNRPMKGKIPFSKCYTKEYSSSEEPINMPKYESAHGLAISVSSSNQLIADFVVLYAYMIKYMKISISCLQLLIASGF